MAIGGHKYPERVSVVFPAVAFNSEQVRRTGQHHAAVSLVAGGSQSNVPMHKDCSLYETTVTCKQYGLFHKGII